VTVRRIVAVLVVVLVAAGTAAADHLEPKRQIRPADQARARAMVLRVSDLPPGYEEERTSGLEPHVTCKVLDESDLTLTGEARSPYWSHEYRVVSSGAVLYRTAAQSARAWATSTSPAGLRCLRDAFAKSLAPGQTLRATLEKLAIPRITERTVSYRITISGDGSTSGPSVRLDFVLLKQGRAQAVLGFIAVLVPPERANEVALARVVGRRMIKAMRGA
jgi:hypothetical protein